MQRRLLAIVCVGTVVVASVARTQDPPPVNEAPKLELIDSSGWDVEEARRSGDDALRERLLQLVQEKAKLMDREALEEALTDVQGDIGELQALRKLEEARQILSSIVEEHEGTEGAGRARRMLDTDDERHSAPRFNPI